MFGSCKSHCGPCRVEDPVAERIKVNPFLLDTNNVNPNPTLLASGASNMSAAVMQSGFGPLERKREDELSREAERKRAEAAEAERSRSQAEAAAEAEARVEEDQQPAFKASAQCRFEEERRLEEEQRLRDEQQRLQKLEQVALQDAALRAQQALDAAERAERLENEAARKRVQTFLKDNKFSGLNLAKKSFMSRKYALHAAVEMNNAQITQSLLRCKADPTLQNSSKKTPFQLAESMNKRGSRDQVLAVLRAHVNS
mmetsp:Transcript_116104/g.223981  ORF Transcript_116104/g.223981 Transcript_116104/m.223981 type:complete len:256 (+) Transcript_116104:92-859(+)